jgi:branched-chain amino acid transport system permease protein
MNTSIDRKWVWLGGILVLALLLVLPFLVKNYRVFQFNLVIVYAIAVLGLNILTGYNGQFSLGHGAFYAIGAYASAILMDQAGLPYWATLPLAALVCFIFGILMGFPALRLEGHFLALATFALALAVPQLLKYKKLEGLTGGVQGIVLNKPEPPFSFRFLDQNFNADRWLYYFSLFVAAVMFLIAWNLLRGRVGRALVAIRDHPIAASAMGINLTVFKTLAFGVSAAFTGVAGALGAIVVAFVAPDSFTVFLSITFLVAVVIGGLASISGAIFGAIFIQFVPNVADEISKSAPWAIYGVFLIVFMYLMPVGVAGMLAKVWGSIRRRTGAVSAPAQPR